MKSAIFAPFAEFFRFKFIGSIYLVFFSNIVSSIAFFTNEK